MHASTDLLNPTRFILFYDLSDIIMSWNAGMMTQFIHTINGFMFIFSLASLSPLDSLFFVVIAAPAIGFPSQMSQQRLSSPIAPLTNSIFFLWRGNWFLISQPWFLWVNCLFNVIFLLLNVAVFCRKACSIFWLPFLLENMKRKLKLFMKNLKLYKMDYKKTKKTKDH